jgi:hypothetical protein
MGGPSGSSNTQKTEKSEVWGGQAPFLESLYSQGADLYQNFQPTQSGVPGQAQSVWNQQLTQQPGQNPYLDAMASQYQDQLGAMNQNTGGQAGLTGGYGGGRQGVLESQNQQNIGNQMGQFYGQQYQQDMNRQQQGIQNALGQTGTMYGLDRQQDPWQQQMQALQQSGALLGNPTVLGQGSSSSKQGSGLATGFGMK